MAKNKLVPFLQGAAVKAAEIGIGQTMTYDEWLTVTEGLEEDNRTLLGEPDIDTTPLFKNFERLWTGKK